MSRAQVRPTTKYFIRCFRVNCKTVQELHKGIKTKAQLCWGCRHALVYTTGPDVTLPGQVSETVFAGQVEVVTYGAARKPRQK